MVSEQFLLTWGGYKIVSKVIQQVQQKDKESLQEEASTQKIMQSSVGPSFKEAMAQIKEKRVEAMKVKAAIEKHVETKRNKK